MNNENLRQQLVSGATEMAVDLSDLQCKQLLTYLELFEKWNRAYNLSAVRDIEKMLNRHLLDSLSVIPHLQFDRLIDVGTGGGLPGIPIAIMYPDKPVTLLDSNGKKMRFLFQVKTSLGLDNVTIVNERVESYQPPALFDAVISRAFASLEDMTTGCRHLLTDNGVFWAMKGIYPVDELSALEKRYKVQDSCSLAVPGEPGERHLLKIVPAAVVADA